MVRSRRRQICERAPRTASTIQISETLHAIDVSQEMAACEVASLTAATNEQNRCTRAQAPRNDGAKLRHAAENALDRLAHERALVQFKRGGRYNEVIGRNSWPRRLSWA
jgi:hypothetical protein